MTTKENMNSLKKTARVAGSLYLLLYVIVFIGGAMYISSGPIIVPGDAAATATNIMANEGLSRAGIVNQLFYQTVFILVGLALYKLLKPVNKNHAVLMVIFLLAGVPIAMFNLLYQFVPLLLLSGADYLTSFTEDQLHALMKLFLDLHDSGIFIAQIFWGLWLLPLGYLVFKSGYIPRILGVLMVIGGFGYLIDVVIFFLFPNFEVKIGLFTWWGELLLPLWLVIKGVKDQP